MSYLRRDRFLPLNPGKKTAEQQSLPLNTGQKTAEQPSLPRKEGPENSGAIFSLYRNRLFCHKETGKTVLSYRKESSSLLVLIRGEDHQMSING